MTDQSILDYFKNSTAAPGNRLHAPATTLNKFQRYNGYDRFTTIEQKLGRRAKRVLDRARHPNFHTAREIHTPSLDHYEDMEWWERDASNDFLSYI